MMDSVQALEATVVLVAQAKAVVVKPQLVAKVVAQARTIVAAAQA